MATMATFLGVQQRTQMTVSANSFKTAIFDENTQVCVAIAPSLSNGKYLLLQKIVSYDIYF